MSTSDVLRLEEYRGRREQRLRRTLALNRGHPARTLVLERFAVIARALRADRVVAAWVDEYGDVRAHPWAVLDLASDRPRRQVAAEPLIRSWRAGVPGIAEGRGSDGAPDGSGTCAVSLGSDGVRLWFVLVEPASYPWSLTSACRETLMFLAGECGAVLLHMDMDHADEPWGEGLEPALGVVASGRPDELARAALVDLARYLVEEAMVPEPGPLEYRLEVVGRMLPALSGRAGPAAMVEAARRREPDALAAGLVRTATWWEERGAFREAQELYALAYEAACQAGACSRGGGAARGVARTLRRSARWDRALVWYDVARSIARARDDAAEEAIVLDGVASVHLGRGGVPAARSVLDEARVLARRSGDADAMAAVRFSLMTVAHTEGRLDEAAAHGWEAFRRFRTRAARLRSLTALGGVFLAGRRLDSAEDAFAVVERESGEAYYRLYALAGLARVQAARGDREGYEAALGRLDEAGLEEGAPELRAEVLLERGDGYRELGDPDEAERWYGEAVRVAEAHGVSEYLIRAERALEAMEREGSNAADASAGGRRVEEPVTDPVDMEAIRRGLGALRRGALGVGGGQLVSE